MTQDKEHQIEQGYRALRSIRRILRQVSAHSRALATQTGLTVPQLLCLRAIDSCDDAEVTVLAVSQAVHLSKSTVSLVVDRLVKKELVTRTRSANDRRKVHLELTTRGQACVASLPNPLQDKFLDRLSALPDGRQETLLAALEEVVALMDAEDVDAAPLLVDDPTLS